MQPFSDVLADYAAAGSARHYYGYDFQLHVCVEPVSYTPLYTDTIPEQNFPKMN